MGLINTFNPLDLNVIQPFILRMKSTLLSSFLLLFLLSDMSAQSYFNVLSLSSNVSPNNTYRNQDARLTIQDYSGSLQVPLQIDTNNILLVGMSGSKTAFTYTSNQLQNTNSQLSTVAMQIGWQKNTQPSKQRLIMLIPSIKSDFEDVTGVDYQIGMAVLYTKKVKPNLKLRYGLYANKHNFGPFLAPLFGLDYAMKNNWRLFGTLPAFLTLEKKFNKRFRAGADLRISTSTYRFSENIGNPYMQQNLNYATAFIEAYPQKVIALRFAAGHSIFRSYRAYAQNQKLDLNILGIGIGEKRQELPNNEFGEVKNGLVFEISLFIRVEID